MEDDHIVDIDFTTPDGKKACFLGVFDGHGGDQVAHYCSEIYVDTLMKTEPFKKGDYEQALIDTNIQIDELMKTSAVNDKLKTIGEGQYYEGMFGDLVADGVGCTSVVALIIDNKIYCGNAGDSRCVIMKGNAVKPLSVDHKPSLQSELDRITAAGGTVENGRVNGNLNLTRTIGDLMYKRQTELGPEKQVISCYPDITVEPIDGSEQLLILACDGIWDVLSNEKAAEKAVDYIKKGCTMKEVCEKITMDCLSKQPYSTPGWDNMTLLIAKFSGYNPEPYPKEDEAVDASCQSQQESMTS